MINPNDIPNRAEAEETLELLLDGAYDFERSSYLIMPEIVNVIVMLADDLAELKGESK